MVDRLPDDDSHQVVWRVVAARILAREDVGPNGDRPVFAHDLPLEQPLIDGPELLDAEVPVVDVAAAVRRLLERERVDDIRHHCIAEPHVGQQRRAFPVEQAPVVGRQADRGVAGVDGAAEIVEGRPVTGGTGRKDVAGVLAAADVTAHFFSKRVVVVAVVPHRQQVAIFGIEYEQEAVEQDQRGIAHLGQWRVGRGMGDGAGKVGKDLSEDQAGEAGGHPLLMEAAFLDGALVKRPLVGGVGQEGVPPEHQCEQPQPMAAATAVEGEQAVVVAGQVEHGGQVEFEELFRDGEGALVVETPLPAVGQDAPAQPARCEIVDAPQVPQHLGGRRRLFAATARAAVERAKQALRLDDRKPERVAFPLLGKPVGVVFGRVVGEQQAVGHVFAAARGEVLLAQARGPAERGQHRPDQVILGLALVRRSDGREAREEVSQSGFKIVEVRIGDRSPVG